MKILESPAAQFALEATRSAAVLVRGVQQQMVSPALTKGDRSPVTVADFAAQAVVARMLQEKFPQDVLVGEEDAAALRAPDGAETLAQVTQFVGRVYSGASESDVCDWIDHGAADPAEAFWTLDPIDGTKGFLRGGQYAVALAYVRSGEVQLAVLGCPQLDPGCCDPEGKQTADGERGVLVLAARGSGTWSRALSSGEWTRLHVSDRADAATARMLRSFESGHTNVDQIGQLGEQLGTTAEPVRMDSQAKYAVLAAGAGEVLVRLLSPKQPDYRERIWDQAAGSLIVEEAGGRITDLVGKALDFTQGRTLAANRGILATNGHLHEATLAALRAVNA